MADDAAVGTVTDSPLASICTLARPQPAVMAYRARLVASDLTSATVFARHFQRCGIDESGKRQFGRRER